MLRMADHVALRVSRFALIGGLSTLIYAISAFVLSGSAGAPFLPPVAASVGAYAIAAAFSYAGHKYFTFVSPGAHRLELPRFLTLAASGLLIAMAVPLLLSEMLGLPPAIPILATCIAVPVVNYVMMGRWVFRNS
jgi:putative flippase GtrA